MKLFQSSRVSLLWVACILILSGLNSCTTLNTNTVAKEKVRVTYYGNIPLQSSLEGYVVIPTYRTEAVSDTAIGTKMYPVLVDTKSMNKWRKSKSHVSLDISTTVIDGIYSTSSYQLKKVVSDDVEQLPPTGVRGVVVPAPNLYYANLEGKDEVVRGIVRDSNIVSNQYVVTAISDYQHRGEPVFDQVNFRSY